MGVRCGPAHELQELRGTCPADSVERKCFHKMCFHAEKVLLQLKKQAWSNSCTVVRLNFSIHTPVCNPKKSKELLGNSLTYLHTYKVMSRLLKQ